MKNVGGGIAVTATYAFAGFIAYFARAGGVINNFVIFIFLLLLAIAIAGTWKIVFDKDQE